MIARTLLALFFVAAGTIHFTSPAAYLAIMPPSFPWPVQLVAISGAAEILGGLGVLLPATRRLAGYGLIALLIAVFPANVEALHNGMNLGGHPVPPWVLWARLPLQALLIWWVYLACLRKSFRQNGQN